MGPIPRQTRERERHKERRGGLLHDASKNHERERFSLAMAPITAQAFIGTHRSFIYACTSMPTAKTSCVQAIYSLQAHSQDEDRRERFAKEFVTQDKEEEREPIDGFNMHHNQQPHIFLAPKPR